MATFFRPKGRSFTQASDANGLGQGHQKNPTGSVPVVPGPSHQTNDWMSNVQELPLDSLIFLVNVVAQFRILSRKSLADSKEAMPASPLPLIFPALLILVPLFYLAAGKKSFRRACAGSASVLAVLFLSVYVPSWVQMLKASFGDPAATYELARWTEKHDEQLGQFILWPATPDVLGGYKILEKSAAMGYPPAIYALGVRLKHGIHVPCPADWDGPGGNCFPQPDRGQALIDQALSLGYRPSTSEELFYFGVYRK